MYNFHYLLLADIFRDILGSLTVEDYNLLPSFHASYLQTFAVFGMGALSYEMMGL
jgi:hypothetical protein